MEAKIVNLFYLKKAKANAQGLVPIFQRITVNGKRIDRSTGKFIDQSKWSSEGTRLKGSFDEARTINSYLDSLIANNAATEKMMLAKDLEINAESFKNHLSGKTGKIRTIVPTFQQHNQKIKSLIEVGEYAPGTLQRYEISLKHTVDFIMWKYSISNINVKKIDTAFVADCDFYLRTVRKCDNNTTVKYLKNFQNIIKICLKNRWITKDPFTHYEERTRIVERSYLSGDQIKTIYGKSLFSDRLKYVRDVYIFCCFTGLAYIDVKQLSADHIGIDINGQRWIFKNRQKTESACKIPLLQIPLEILEKYAANAKCVSENRLLPVLSNQKMNSYLKEIADLCGIGIELTFHTARHTFATTVTLTNGVPIESVSKMLGHKNIQTTQHFAKILDKKVSEDMMQLRLKINNAPSFQTLSKLISFAICSSRQP